MYRASSVISVVLAGAVWAQAPAPVLSDPDEALELYLADRQLLPVLAAHLRQRLGVGTPEERVRAAEALGRLYVKMLSEAATPATRQMLEDQSRELLKGVPEAESFELRIDLAKATYLKVETIVENDRLRLAADADKAEAERVLRQVGPVFEELAAKLQRRVDQLESKETHAKDADIEGLRAELTDMRRLRSLARYYSGWTRYYTALLTSTPRLAQEALEDFGYILDAVPGKAASVERARQGMFRYDHVARAAIGCSLCASLLGNDVEATRWLDEVESAEGVSQTILDMLFGRRLAVYAAADRWADAELIVRRRRTDDDNAVKRLSVRDARLLAVVAMEASRSNSTRAGIRAVAERLAQVALGDLVTAGEVAHVLDIVRMFGTSPLGNEGFIVAYVRGRETWETARAAHTASGDPEEPTTDPVIASRYNDAAELLLTAINSPDAAKYPGEDAKAGICRGLSLFYVGRYADAAQALQRAAEAAKAGESRRHALWYGIVALDRAVERGQPSLAPQRDRLATLYLQEFPGTEDAARLLMRQNRADKLSDAQTLEILLKVPDTSPVYEASRRHAARLLYQVFKRAPASARDFAALRFVDLAEPLLRAEHARAMAATDATAKEVANSAVLHVRQITDALLASSVPDLPRVQAALDTLDAVAAFHGLDLRPLEPEFAYRRMQAALARNDEAGATAELDKLRALGGPFAASANRLMLRRAQDQWKAAPSDARLARRVVGYGKIVLEAFERGGMAPGDAGAVSVRDSVADAAAAVFEAEKDTVFRDLAVALDKAQLAAGHRTGSSLRRLGLLLEGAGDARGALEAWQELLVGLPSNADAWYEARYESLRLLATLDPAEAAQAMQQHRVLHPGLGPEPWGTRLAELERQIGAPATPAGGGP